MKWPMGSPTGVAARVAGAVLLLTCVLSRCSEGAAPDPRGTPQDPDRTGAGVAAAPRLPGPGRLPGLLPDLEPEVMPPSSEPVPAPGGYPEFLATYGYARSLGLSVQPASDAAGMLDLGPEAELFVWYGALRGAAGTCALLCIEREGRRRAYLVEPSRRVSWVTPEDG